MPVLERVESAQRRIDARLHPLAAPLLLAVGALAATAYVAQVDPHEGGHYPTCPSLWLTGFYCPGCGSLRAVHDLANLDLAGAWGMNPLTVLVIPWLAWRWLAWVLERIGHPVHRRPAPSWALYLLFAGICVYTVARNVPVLEPYLAP